MAPVIFGSVVVTGSSRGLGLEFVRQLAPVSKLVVATCRYLLWCDHIFQRFSAREFGIFLENNVMINIFHKLVKVFGENICVFTQKP
jgi:NAD(P)-dependent dehydrogenase (short-subunit alcohol dehydrogenase family)